MGLGSGGSGSWSGPGSNPVVSNEGFRISGSAGAGVAVATSFGVALKSAPHLGHQGGKRRWSSEATVR